MTKRVPWMLLLILLATACKPSPTPTNVPSPTQTANSVPAASTPKPTSTPPTATATSIPPTATLLPINTPTPQAYGPDNFPADINPLTGLKVSDLALLNRRPLAVKVQIIPRGERPPWGVSLADLVYDYYQNNGATRFNAIFYGNNADQVGPIRSARLLDISIVRMYKAVFAFGSADQRILSRLYSTEFADRLVIPGSQNCPPMCRIEPTTYDYLVTNTDELSKYATSLGIENDRQDLNGMRFDAQVPQGGQNIDTIYVRFNFSDYNRWDYDPASGSYLRFQDADNDENGKGETYAPLMDRLNNQQIAASNVVILFAPHSFVVRTSSTEIVDINLSGSGQAFAFRDGQEYQVTWNRPSPDAVLSLTMDGAPYPFKPGNTWFQVIGQTSNVEVGANNTPGALRFTFNTP
jgi:hypothetical protein